MFSPMNSIKAERVRTEFERTDRAREASGAVVLSATTNLYTVSAIAPVGFALFNESADALSRVLGFHQFVQIQIFNFLQRRLK